MGHEVERPRQSLHTYVGRLRKLLGSDMIHTQPGVGYQLSIPPDAVDIHRFRDLLRRASEAGTTDEELALLRLARALWRGVPFAICTRHGWTVRSRRS